MAVEHETQHDTETVKRGRGRPPKSANGNGATGAVEAAQETAIPYINGEEYGYVLYKIGDERVFLVTSRTQGEKATKITPATDAYGDQIAWSTKREVEAFLRGMEYAATLL